MGRYSVSVVIATLSTLSILQPFILQPVWAEELEHPATDPATTVAEWIAQFDTSPVDASPVDASPVVITNVRVESIESGLRLVLETASGFLTPPETRVVENALIADVANGAIAQEFSQANPVEGVALVTVTALPDDRVRIVVTGTDAPPVAEVASTPQALVLDITRGTPETGETGEDTIQVIVTGEADTPYRVPDTSVGTRTDTPILDIPQSVQVIPQAVIEEQGAETVGEALRNAAGVSSGRVASDTQSLVPVIRGFESRNVLRNGLRDPNFSFGGGTNLSNIERVEILRGPASVLYGQGNLGGTVNLVTEPPLDEPRYVLDYTVGMFDQHRPSLDFTGPLFEDDAENGAIAYRLNLAYDSSDSFRDFEELESFFVAPVVRIGNADETQLILDLEYFKSRSWGGAPELPALGTVEDNPLGEVDRDANLGEPSLSQSETRVTRLGYRLDHRFNDYLALRNELLVAGRDTPRSNFIIPSRLEPDQRTLTRLLAENPGDQNSLLLNTQLVSSFATGSIDHELLAGIELSRENIEDIIRFRFLDPIDIFDPVYRPETLSDLALPFGDTATRTHALGFYLQDQMTVLDDLILVVGGRFDIVDQDYEDRLNPSESFDRQDDAFSPRVGLVYQPTDTLSLYASYTRSFEPVIGRARSLNPVTNQTIVGDPFEPERGTQYEVGLKADLLDGRLLTTLALYHLERTNVVTQGADSPLSSVQVGEQRSRGVELNVAGELLPGWNILASYAFTDAEITKDTQFEEGNRLPNAPRQAASLWTTYELQWGQLAGLGIGLGLFFQGERQGDLSNTFDLPGYVRTDATVFYRRDRLRLALNVQNLFDIEYYEGARNDVRVIPGEPLTLSGTIRWEF